ncbi:MAG: hypothetical protein CFH06_00235 [Alphaproteobacteria bacterium MarineAlpha3_Bin5]|nr:hypothetical protein [Magnetovibrio sp.]PPR79821.1 MAG: hypothetical protein CFH06_00235 [Alphaproteobacteria bacterium MarineAlpha3_Bin5]|tara:strand:+ start:148 stop:960 length:813 start_codon:yes stop_codon:yes gene_type:complete
MFKFSISNIALNAFDHTKQLQILPELGFQGIEVAPSRVWKNTWHGLTANQVDNYRQSVEKADLKIVGLHSLFFDHPELGLFRNSAGRKETLEFLQHLSLVCRDLGGKTLIWGSGRRRKKISSVDAYSETLDFMGLLCSKIEDHGTCFCFEPLGPSDTDFLNSARETTRLAKQLNHPAVKVQLDAKALIENGEATLDVFKETASLLVHFHANEPGLGILGSSGQVNHSTLSKYLKKIRYNGYISVEQRQLNQKTALQDIQKSASTLIKAYR